MKNTDSARTAENPRCRQQGVTCMPYERPDWDSYFMTIAAVAATRSTCLRRQVGAVIVRDGQIIRTAAAAAHQAATERNEAFTPASPKR